MGAAAALLPRVHQPAQDSGPASRHSLTGAPEASLRASLTEAGPAVSQSQHGMVPVSLGCCCK